MATTFLARGLALLAALVLGGCATAVVPLEQVRHFSQAFAAVDTVAQPLLDELALAERTVGRRAAVARARAPAGAGDCGSTALPWVAVPGGAADLGYVDGLCLDDAAYHAALADPPATAQLRGGLRVVERYAEVLGLLVEQRNVEQALAEVDALGQEVGGLLSLAGANLALAPVLGALRPLLAEAARQSNADEARRLIVAGAPRVDELLQALRAAAPAMFRILVADARRAADVAATAPQAVQQIEARRVAVSQYALLLAQLQRAWGATVAAAERPGGARLADLVARTAALRAQADAVRRGLAALRGSPAPP